MANPGKLNAWSDFKERTAIHGFSEYGGMRSRCTKVAWVCLSVIVSVFCIEQLYELTDTFIKNEPMTNVRILSKMQMPEVGFRFDWHVLKYFDGYINNQSYAAYHGLMNDIGILNRVKYRCAASGEPMLLSNSETNAAFYHGSGGGKVVTDLYSSLIPNSTAYIQGANEMWMASPEASQIEFVRGSERAIDHNGKAFQVTTDTLITTFGPVYRFRFPTVTTVDMDRLFIKIHDPTESSMSNQDLFFTFLFGTEANSIGPAAGMQLEHGTLYYLTLSFTEYRYSNRYCNDRLYGNGSIDCITRCFIDAAKAGSTEKECVPYLGDHREAAGLRICGLNRDADYCKTTEAHCRDKCDKCNSCRPCTYVVGSVVIEKTQKMMSMKPTTDLNLKIANPNHIQQVQISERYTGVGFASQIGGILGLCFGVSVLSIMHCLYSMVAIVGQSTRHVTAPAGGPTKAARF